MSIDLKSNVHQNNLKGFNSSEKPIYEFENYRLDAANLMLYRADEEIHLPPKQVETLLALVEGDGEIVSKDELIERLWANSFVDESNLIQNIYVLRKILGETADGKPMIETLRRRGYRFNGELKQNGDRKFIVKDEPSADDSAKILQFSPDAKPENKVVTGDQNKPSGLQRRTIYALAAVVLIAFAGLAFYFYTPKKAVAPHAKSIIVLPVKPINAGVRDELYEIGIADALINRLGAMKGFYVRPLSATRQYADIAQDPIAAGKEQQTDYVLAANYQIADGRVRLTAQLYNVESGQIEDTYKIEKEASGIFAVQDAVTGEVVKSLQARLGMIPDASAARRGTMNEEAYRLFLQGKNLADRRNPSDFRKAIDYFEQALRLDPNYALALAWMANAYHGLGVQRAESPRDVIEKAKQAVKRALELDPNLAEAYTVRARINYSFEWDFAATESDFQRALELEPNNDMTHCWYAVWASYNGRFDQAMTEIETALAINPGSVYYQRERGRILYFARRYDEAVAQLKRVSELEESFIHLWLTNAYQMQGDQAGAYEAFIKFQKRNNPDRLAAYQKKYETSGWDGVRQQYIEFSRLDAVKTDVSLTSIAKQSALLGEKEEAFEFLTKAVEKREWMIVTMNVEPAFDSLHSDARFNKLVSRIGLK